MALKDLLAGIPICSDPVARNELAKAYLLSYSSEGIFETCQRKFCFNRWKVPTDPSDKIHFAVGKAFHLVNEWTRHGEHCEHTLEAIRPLICKAMAEESITAEIVEYPRQAAMLLQYWKLHKASGLTCAALEMKIGDEWETGFIDAVMQNNVGHWWIVDLKTAARFDDSMPPRLGKDPQLLKYASYKEDVAEKCGLNVDDFQGCLYRVTTKTKIAVKVHEAGPEGSWESYVARAGVSTYEVAVVLKESDIIEQEEISAQNVRAARSLLAHGIPKANYRKCYDYFSPCEYFSKCFGKTFAELKEEVVVFTAENQICRNVIVEDISVLD